MSEDTDALFFDGDGDGDFDLYVCHGGKAFSPYSIDLNDAYYINNGTTFIKAPNSPNFNRTMSSSVVTSSDFDNDGDNDLFVGERFKTNLYGLPVSGYILENDGKGNFTAQENPLFKDLGMITDAKWNDINKDGWEDLIIVGEWMPIKVFINNQGVFEDHSANYGLEESSGLWKTVELKDIDGDGDTDIISGNIGQNAFYEGKMKMFIADFDGNGFQEQLICKERDGKYYPIADKDELISQIPSLKKKFLYYKDYARADISSIFSEEQIKNTYAAEIDMVESTVFINENGKFTAKALPDEIQYAPIYSIAMEDINNDGHQDIFLGGNQFMVKPQFGRYDASKGWAIFGPFTLENTQKDVIPLFIDGQIRAMTWIDFEGKKILTIGKNNEEVLFYAFKNNF
ncbi:VCBS repeat-containing protein [Maribacter litopenaei]|uniref:VCBS repeat-containing protein n=2 Tax=Maribacter litopenaei TaxID=2976127 RepID=A0ABY5YC43_9FLAO|nr:VCBS repeat-containing protein [Maribacter litopenaei]UWX56638.1 VCBS repeat-containing protein [Maribacter litopenaei]